MSKLDAGAKESQQILQVLNSLLKKKLYQIGMVEIGRNSKFYEKEAIDDGKVEGSDLKVWRGFTTSIQIVNGNAYLMVDFSTRVLRSNNLLTYMRKINKDEKRDLIGQTVLAPYGNYNTYKIEGIDTTRSPASTFLKNGQEISFKDYFKKAYGFTVKENDQPLIITSIKKKVIGKGNIMEEVIEPICILPELVTLTGMTDEERKDRKLMQNLAKWTKL
jgi:aubergine-like protein